MVKPHTERFKELMNMTDKTDEYRTQLFVFPCRQKPYIDDQAGYNPNLDQYQPQRTIDIESGQHTVESKQQTAAECVYALPHVKRPATGRGYAKRACPAGNKKYPHHQQRSSQAQTKYKCNIIYHNHMNLIKHNLAIVNILKNMMKNHTVNILFTKILSDYPIPTNRIPANRMD